LKWFQWIGVLGAILWIISWSNVGSQHFLRQSVSFMDSGVGIDIGDLFRLAK
jgi:hypothetical protein